MPKLLPGMVLAVLLATPLAAFAQTLPPPTQPTANWAGYVATNAHYTRVSTLIQAPTPMVLQRFGTAWSWVGVGGYVGNGAAGSHDLIQAGLAEANSGTLFAYRAWYEMLPAGPVAVPIEIQPQSWVSVDIHEVAYDQWQVSIVNGTNVWTRQFHYVSSHSSAEWVLEAPAIVTGQGVAGFEPLAGVAGANFAKMAAVANGVNAIPSQLFPQSTTIVSPFGIKAVPTGLGPDGASFNVTTTPA